MPDAALLDALSSLRDALIDRLQPDWRPVVQRHRLDDQARGLLQRLQTELADKVRESRHGVHGVLTRYRDALSAYPDQVNRAVKAYSIVGARPASRLPADTWVCSRPTSRTLHP